MASLPCLAAVADQLPVAAAVVPPVAEELATSAWQSCLVSWRLAVGATC